MEAPTRIGLVGGVAAHDMRRRRPWMVVLAVVLAAWAMLAVADGVAWAEGDGEGSGHADTHQQAKPAPPRQRAKAAGETKPVAPKTDPQSSRKPTSAKDHGTPTKPSAAPAVAVAATTSSSPAPKVTKLLKVPTGATPVSAVTTASSPHTPLKPSSPRLPDSATVAALGEELQRKSNVSTQLSPGYLVNSVVNTVGAALAGTAEHVGAAWANNVRQATQFTRQMVGLGFDVGAMLASEVKNTVTQDAQKVGPNLLWGLPYKALTGIATTAGDISKVLTGTPLNATSSGPFAVDYGVYNLLGFSTPLVPPPGANDPSITVTAQHPLPIILINATATTQNFDWSVGAPVLANAGYKVFTFNYGNNTSDPNFPVQSIADITKSGEQLSAEVDMVLAQTGAPQVILIGHSQGGGILPEYYINNLGGASKVSQLIGIAPSNHGTNLDGITGLLAVPILGTLIKGLVSQGGAAWLQQAMGSSLVHQVYDNGDTRPGVIYDTIASTNDEVVTPYTQQALSGPNVTNVVVQDQNPGFAGGHLNIAINYGVWQDILGMLAANPAANLVQPVAAVA
ncbi:alpha/beta fold hydrolase [Mycobacterium sp. PDNC021]|uniref:alpha/beta fold hydrolase n=1 Tax=Mycobacterium sp. PDNC021 TaxID=3391399 RepID=UPI003AAD8445